MKARLHADFETYSELDLKVVGLPRYARHPSTNVWCLGYALDEEEPFVWRPDLHGWDCPTAIYKHVKKGGTVVAHNAPFELSIWNHILHARHGWPLLTLEQMDCTMARAYAMALPGSLEMAAVAVGLDIGKDKTGHELMMKMCKPYGRTRKPDGSPVWVNEVKQFTFGGEKVSGQWALDRLCEYCAQDVKVEREVDKRLLKLTPTERAVWVEDRRINARGIPFDMDAVQGAVEMRDVLAERADGNLDRITNGAVVKSTALPALKDWLLTEHLVAVDSLDKEHIEELMLRDDIPAEAKEAIGIRSISNRATSIKKLDVVLNCNIDGRVQDSVQYHGAGTGRWAGRNIQPHNFTRDLPEDPALVEELMEMYAQGVDGIEMVELVMGEPIEAISKCMRGFIKAPDGSLLMGGDWSNVEGRGTAWLAGEEWKLGAFIDSDNNPDAPDVYEQTYAATFNIDPRDVTKEDRQIGKVEELAFGYEGGVGAFHSMNKKLANMLGDDAIDEIKDGWRRAHLMICGDQDVKRSERGGLWRELERAAIDAVINPGVRFSIPNGLITFRKVGSFLWMKLPSGRALCYAYPQVRENSWGSPYLTYKTNPSAKEWAEGRVIFEKGQSRFWARVGTYGGKLTENAVQALCRDILRDAILNCAKAGVEIVLHVHDEIVAEALDRVARRQYPTFSEIMNRQPKWAGGFPVKAGCWLSQRYIKG